MSQSSKPRHSCTHSTNVVRVPDFLRNPTATKLRHRCLLESPLPIGTASYAAGAAFLHAAQCPRHSPCRLKGFDMTSFPQHTLDTAPKASRPLLHAARAAWGFVPTLHAALAESPVALAAYTSLFDLVATATLNEKERQIAFLATSVLHGCEYCVAGHTFLARKAGLSDASLQAIRSGAPIVGNAREHALRTFCEAVVRERGLVGDAAVGTFLAAGFTKCNVLEVVTIVATKVISNHTNHLAHTPQESFMSDPALNWVAKKAA
jgi:uncharacterized peroxidase-related enzyme